MSENYEKARRIIMGQEELMVNDGIDRNFINKFNDETIDKLQKELNLTDEEVCKLKDTETIKKVNDMFYKVVEKLNLEEISNLQKKLNIYLDQKRV